ncbi:MAG: 16S rRNA (cytosine(1402)-N(4))-methyltransferase RsmH [Magnetococcales bacterium]|nr:16S rRNA (cytosine(1402)-N(4))-methyltransferase RsmH [Magnetococcales bacterium]
MNQTQEQSHQPVLLHEVVAALCPVATGCYIDATFGRGGHTEALLMATAPFGQVLAMDRDPDAIAAGKALLQKYPARFKLMHGSFDQLTQCVQQWRLDWEREIPFTVRGILFDLGVSSPQIDCPERGFSFLRDGPLDMRMDPSSKQGLRAMDLIRTMKEQELADVLFQFGEERHARRIARIIVAERARQPLTTTRQLSALLERHLTGRSGGIHPATRTFQALRIVVNDELAQLRRGLDQAIDLLAPGGRLAVISFHSLEDRIVKQKLRAASEWPQPPAPGLPRPSSPPPCMRLMARKPLYPGDVERQLNPRARSARMRLAERLPAHAETSP